MLPQKLNLTIGAFNFSYAEMFIVKDGQTRTGFKALQKLLDILSVYGYFNCILKTSAENKLGKLQGDVYETGVLGMLQRQEVDLCFLPLPLDILDAPGNFSSVIHEDVFHIFSFPQSSSTVTQNIGKSLEKINPSLWLVMLAFILILETINHLIKSSLWYRQNNLIASMYETINTFACTIFGQYIPGRSFLRTAQIIGLMLFSIILGASFSTSTIVGNDGVKINTLKDVIEQKKKPLFLEGESTIELFQLNVTPDYANIYILAKQKGTEQPLPLGDLDIFYTIDSESVYFCSKEIARVVSTLGKVFDASVFNREYKSFKPYHSSLNGFLINPIENAEEIKERIKKLSLRQLQGKIFIQYLRKVMNELLVESNLGISEIQIILAHDDSENHYSNFQSLNLNGCKTVLVAWALLITATLVIAILEIVTFHAEIQLNAMRAKRSEFAQK